MLANSNNLAVNILSDLVDLLFEILVISVDLVEHCFVVCETLNRLNTVINDLIAFLNFGEKGKSLLSVVAFQVGLSNEGIDELFDTSLDRGL